MGNQLTVPSLSSWHIEDFNNLGLKNSTSIFDGTFILSFRASQGNQSVAVKAIQLNNEYAQNVASTFANEYYKVFERLTIPGNFISNQYVSKNGAYLIRPFQDTSIPERLMGEPPLEPIDLFWITFQLFMAVKNLHKAGAYHGDIKPENVLIGSDVQVTLTDHAPFKPQVIGPNQPHFFIHFFSYGRPDAYLAPERISNDLSYHPDMCAADLFSLGCVIAYLYTNGETLFNFTSLIQYSKNKNNNSLKILDKIKDQNVKNLILKLIDPDPQHRIDNFSSLFSVFPPWFDNFYSQINKFPNSIITDLNSIFPSNISNDLIIYLTYFSVLLHGPLPISSFLKMMPNYTSCVALISDIRLKVTRILPFLINLLKRQSALVAAIALDSLIEIVKTIPSIEKESEIVKSFCGVYFLPQLSQFMKFTNNQQAIITRIPMILVEFSRLWPSILDELPLRSAFLEPLMPIHFGQTKTHENSTVLIQSFLSAAKKVSYTKSYKIFKVFCLMVFQILCPAYIPFIIDFLLTYLSLLVHTDKLKFYSEFYNLFQIPLIQYQPDESNPESMSVVLNAFVVMINDGCIPVYHYSSIAKLAFQHLSSRYSSVRAAAKLLIRNLPPSFSQFEILASTKPKLFSNPDSQPVMVKRSFSSELSLQQNYIEPQNKSTNNKQRFIPSPTLLSSSKIAAGKIHKIFLNKFPNKPFTCIIHHSNSHINQYYIDYEFKRKNNSKHSPDSSSSETGFSYKSINRDPFHEMLKLTVNQEIVNVDVINGRTEIFITLRNKILMQSRDITTTLYDSKANMLTACTIVGPRTMAVANKNELTCNDLAHQFRIEGTYKFGPAQSIKGIFGWTKMNYNLFTISTNRNELAFFDRRSAVPIITTSFSEHLTQAVFLQNFQYAASLNDSVVNLFDLRRPYDSKYILGSFKERPVFQLNGHVDSLLPLDDSFIVLNHFGTFALMNGTNGYALYDQKKFVPLKPRNGFIENPIFFNSMSSNKSKRLTMMNPLKSVPPKSSAASLLASETPISRSDNLLHSQQSNIAVIDLPNENSFSVHHHLFPITAGTSYQNGKICISGDAAGFVNIWSTNCL